MSGVKDNEGRIESLDDLCQLYTFMLAELEDNEDVDNAHFHIVEGVLIAIGRLSLASDAEEFNVVDLHDRGQRLVNRWLVHHLAKHHKEHKNPPPHTENGQKT